MDREPFVYSATLFGAKDLGASLRDMLRKIHVIAVRLSYRKGKRIKRPFGLYRVAFFHACNASSSDHPYGLNFTLSKHIPKTVYPNTAGEAFISL